MRRIGAFQPRQRAQRMRVVIVSTRLRHRSGQCRLASMAEGRMADIVGETERLCQILVQPQGAGEDTADLRDFDAVREAGAVMVAIGRDEDLRLGAQAAKGDRMDDPVPITLEFAARPRISPRVISLAIGNSRPRDCAGSEA